MHKHLIFLLVVLATSSGSNFRSFTIWVAQLVILTCGRFNETCSSFLHRLKLLIFFSVWGSQMAEEYSIRGWTKDLNAISLVAIMKFYPSVDS